jgi:glyoxylase-like metal-dependent hydrolase (beta-lactamase superfamily II)/8-oxo-dGTP pyrophosphatase MutT (NUDIX family)
MATDRESSASRAREAAVVVLFRRTPRLEVFRVLRAPGLAYLGGFHAFAGGAVSALDGAVPVAGAGSRQEAARLASAARELFEETGVLLARLPDGRAAALDARARDGARASLDAGRLGFAEFLEEEGLVLRAADLVPAGRWISPPFLPRAFDTYFYLAELPEGEAAGDLSGELSGGGWVAPEEGLSAWRQGASLLATPVRRALEVLASLGPERDAHAWGEAMSRSPAARGGAVERIEVTPGAVLLPVRTPTLPPATHTNCLVLGEGECLLVDPGSGEAGDLEATEKLLSSLAQDGRRIQAIAITHHHGDHTGGVQALRGRLGVPVWTHPLLAGRLRAERVLSDGEKIRLASVSGEPWLVEAHFTPGHTADHVVYLERRRGVLAAGDLVSGLSTVVIDPPDGDLADYMDSLERALAFRARVAFPGHGPPIGAPRERFEALLAHRRWREERVREALRNEGRELADLVPAVYEDVIRERWKLAERSLLAHLLALEKRGEAIRREADGRTLWSRVAPGARA